MYCVSKVLLYKNMTIFLQPFPFHLNCSKLFLSVESYCFDERNRFRQFSESVPGVGALFSFFKKFPMVLPLLTSGQGVSKADGHFCTRTAKF